MGYKLIMSKKAVVSLNSSTTGIHHLDDVNGIKELYNYLFSIKSAANVIIWLRFTKLCCPGKYKPINYLRIIGRAFIASILIMLKLKINKFKQITTRV
jgi:hypothetical protein